MSESGGDSRDYDNIDELPDFDESDSKIENENDIK